MSSAQELREGIPTIFDNLRNMQIGAEETNIDKGNVTLHMYAYTRMYTCIQVYPGTGPGIGPIIFNHGAFPDRNAP